MQLGSEFLLLLWMLKISMENGRINFTIFHENKFSTILEYVEFGDAKGCLSLREGVPFFCFL